MIELLAIALAVLAAVAVVQWWAGPPIPH